MNYYISDLHLCHSNILKFDNRPFETLEKMHETIISNWNATVGKTDTVYILGDFCWGKEQDWISILKKLQGHKVLIRGNHDLKNMSANLKKYFQSVTDYKEISDNGHKVILSHYPILMYRSAYNENVYMLYGHVHDTREHEFVRKWRDELRKSATNRGDNLGQIYNAGCMLPHINYTPRTLIEIISGDDETYGSNN